MSNQNEKDAGSFNKLLLQYFYCQILYSINVLQVNLHREVK